MAQTDTKIVKLLKKQREISKRGLSTQYDNTGLCQSYYNGSPQSLRDVIQFEDTAGRRRKAMVNFNKVQSNVDAVVGFFAQNRRQAKYIARLSSNQGQQLYSKNMNALYAYHRENTNADQLETKQDSDLGVCGYGAIETDLSYIMGNATTDPNGEIIKMKLDPMRVGWDPSAKAQNLLDAKWVYYWEDFELAEALKLFQGSVKDDFESVSEEETSMSGYVYNPWGGLYDKIKLLDSVEWTSKEKDLVRVFNHQWMEYETFYRAVNPLYIVEDPVDALFIQARLDVIRSEIETNGPDGIEYDDMFTFDPKAEELTFNEETKRILVKEFGDMIDPVAFTRKVFYTAVTSGDHIFTKFRSICQQGFSVKFKTGIYNETDKIWVGMVNSMMEPQKYYNKALTELMFTIAANSKGGVMVEEDAVEDIAEFETKWAKTDAVIKVQAGALAGGKIQEKTRAALPTGLENIITLSEAAISSAGVDPSFLGQIDAEDQSGILYKRRIRQVISKMYWMADAITLFQKEDARLCGDLIPIWMENNNGQYIRIIGEDGSDEFAQISKDMLAPEYDVSIQEAPQSTEDKQQTAQLLGVYGDKLMMTNPQAGMAFYAESLQNLPLDGDARNRLIQVLQPKDDMVPMQQYQQLEQQLQELMGQMQQLQAAKIQSDIEYNQAKTDKERAATADTLEAAATKGLENDIMRSGGYSEAKVSI